MVCVNKEKEIYKYVALEDVLFKNKKLKDILKEKDVEISKLQDRVKNLEASTQAIKNYINFSKESGDDF